MSIFEEGLTNNAVDYLSRSIKAYHRKDRKEALLYLWSGLLLLMKVRLARRSDVLIMAQLMDSVDLSSSPVKLKAVDRNKHYRTVDYRQILERLILIGEEKSIIFKYHKSFEKVQQHRNRFEHFQNEISEAEILQLYGETIPFVNEFLEDELNIDPATLFTNWHDFLGIEKFAESREKTAREFYKANRQQHSDIANGEKEQLVDECPQCGSPYAIEINHNLVCKNCGYAGEIYECCRCGTKVSQNGWESFDVDSGMCGTCLEHLFNQE